MHTLPSSQRHYGSLTREQVRMLLLMWSILALNVMLIVFVGIPFAQC